VPLDEPKGLLGRALNFYSRRKYGQVLDNGLALMHNRRVMVSDVRFELSVARWNKLDPQLKALAVMATATQIECSWCLDFGYYEAHSHGLDTEKIAAVPHWRTSNVFTGAERRVLAYAEAMTVTPPAVTDEMAEELRADLGDDGLAELTMMVAVENLRSRFNSALGLSSQGFSESCRVR
jgi:AhpD family alkylhydroperoxidase